MNTVASLPARLTKIAASMDRMGKLGIPVKAECVQRWADEIAALATPAPSAECNCASGRGVEHCVVHAPSVSPAVEGEQYISLDNLLFWIKRDVPASLTAAETFSGRAYSVQENLVLMVNYLREHRATPEQPGSAVQGEAVMRQVRVVRIADGSVVVPWHEIDAETFEREKHGWLSQGSDLRCEYRTLYTTPPPAPAAEQGEL